MLQHTALDIQQRENEGILILDLRGKVEMNHGDITLRDRVEALLGQGNRQLILDMAQVSAIDTVGSSIVLELAQQYQAAAGKLVLLKVDSVHAEIYEMARLEAVIEIYSVELDAVNSFFPDRAVRHYDILEYVESQHEDHDDQE